MELTLGCVIKTPIKGASLFDHEGVVTGFTYDGRALVTHASAATGTTTEDPIEVMTEGQDYRVEYPSALAPHEVVRRAKSMQGTPYNFFTDNCRDVVRHAHGLGYAGKALTALAAVLVVLVAGYAAVAGARMLAKAK